MCVLSTLRYSLTNIIGSCVTWHPQGITDIRLFTIESCSALLKKPTSKIKRVNSKEATPFTIISNKPTIQTISKDNPLELILLPDHCYPEEDEFLCHTYRRDYIEWKSDQQMNESINNEYLSEFSLSFINEEEEILYG